MINIIFWDVDGTLLNFLAAESAAVKGLFLKFGFGECSDEMIAEYSQINKKYWKQIEKGEITKEEALRARFVEFFASHGLPVAAAEKFNAEYQVRLGDTVAYCDNSFEIVRSLRGKVKQYAASNGTVVAQKRKLKNSGLDALMDGIFLSEAVGAEKPDVRFFNAAFAFIEKSGIKIAKENTLIVGDSLTSDILGGKNAGIKTCFYNPRGEKNTSNVLPDYEIKNLNEIYDILKKA